jgi:serine/threonine-protein kinase
MSTDHNLLFGVLALQADLLDATRFADACSAWAARKETPLADLLVERGWLTPGDRADVEKLLQRKLEKHQGDARAGLAEVTTDEVRHSLASVADADVLRSLAEMPARPSPKLDPTTAHQPEGRGRYTLTRLHAQGGIGQVWLAHDADLGRDVALKELRPERSDHAVAQARFLEEACITGQLEHPGIVPVHELVRGEDGRPFYTMRMVRGRTLSEAIKQYHQKRQSGQAGPLELRGLLGKFVAVCNAVAYAHSRDVLHRDLKPANVVLGDYGEVVVLDWGLARLMGQASKPEEATTLLPVSVTGSSRDETMQGQVLGTPAYMAPEQAEGRLDLLGPATDVHGLGAILYEMLTGQPPFAGGPTCEVLHRVLREDPLRPTLRSPGTPRALEAVCLKALAKKPADRYPTAGELASEIERWLADEPVTAWREPAHLRAGRWVRRHQTLVAGLAAGLLVLLLLGGASAIWVSRERDRQRAAAEAALERVATLQQQARWEEARFTLEQAEFRLGDQETATLRQRMRQARDDLELVARLDAIRMQRATLRRDMFNYSGTARAYAEAFAAAGLGAVGDDAQTVARRVADSQVREALVAALDDWAYVSVEQAPRLWLLDVARRADPDEWRDRLRDDALRQDQAKLARVVEQTPDAAWTPSLAETLGAWLAKGDERLLRSAQQRWPGDFWLNFSLGAILAMKRKPQDAEGYCRVALGLRPDNSATCTFLAWVLRQQGKLDEGEKLLIEAIRLDPQNANAHSDLGGAYEEQGKFEEAEKLYRKAVELRPGFVFAQVHVGMALLRQGKHKEAQEAQRKAIDLGPQGPVDYIDIGMGFQRQGNLPEAEKMFRNAIKLDPQFADGHNKLGWVLQLQGHYAEAEKMVLAAIDLKPREAVFHADLGLILQRQGKLAAAEKVVRRAIDLDPRFADGFNKLGWLLELQGQLAEAEKMLRKAIDLDPRFADAHKNLGWVLRLQQRFSEAEKMLRKALELDPKFAEAYDKLGWVLLLQNKLPEAEKMLRTAIGLDPQTLAHQADLGWVLHRQGRTAEAEKQLRNVLELDPKNVHAHGSLGAVLQRLGKLDEAEKHYREAIKLDPKYVWAHCALALLLTSRGNPAEAERLSRIAVELDSSDVDAHVSLGQALLLLGKAAEAEKSFRRVIELDRDHPEAHCNLGHALYRQGEFVRALPSYKRGHELGSRRANWRHPSDRWVRGCEQMIALDAKLAAFLRDDARPVKLAEALQLAELCQLKNLNAAAVRFYTTAFTADAKLADDLKAAHRYNAACHAARAGCGKGKDAGKLDDTQKARLRNQALAWLRADLTAWTNQLQSGKPADRAAVQETMQLWQKDEDFAGVRGKDALAALPEVERQAWSKLWEDVAGLLGKVKEKQP